MIKRIGLLFVFLVSFVFNAYSKVVDDSTSIRLNLPSSWECSSMGEDSWEVVVPDTEYSSGKHFKKGWLKVEEVGDRFICNSGSKKILDIRSIPLSVSSGQVSTTVLKSRLLQRHLEENLGFSVSQKTSYSDNHYISRLDYQDASGQNGAWWIVYSQESATLHRIWMTDTSAVGEKEIESFEEMFFTSVYPVIFDVGFIVVTERSATALTFFLIGVFLLLSLGKKGANDFVKGFEDPGELFSDFGKGETFFYPLALVLCSSFLFVGFAASFRGILLSAINATFVSAQLEMNKLTIFSNVGNDPEKGYIVLAGTAQNLINFFRQHVDMFIQWFPAIVLVLWFTNSLCNYLGSLVVKSDLRFTPTFFASGLLAPYSCFFGMGLLLVSFTQGFSSSLGILLIIFASVMLCRISILGFGQLYRLSTSQSYTAILFSRFMWVIFVGAMIYGFHTEMISPAYVSASVLDYSLVQ